MKILVYVTVNKDRYLGGDPLTLFIENGEERQAFLFALARALQGQVLQLPNGDHMVLREDE